MRDKKVKLFMGVVHKQPPFLLTQTRLKKAEILLRTSPVAINQIAEDCGFLSSKNFWAVFKKYKGVSPREYKKMSK